MHLGRACRMAALVAGVLLTAGGAQAGLGFRPLYQFTGGSDGDVPTGDLLRDAAGNLYGVATGGDNGEGTIFKVSPAGAQMTLHTFDYTAGQSAQPTGKVVMDASGDLYGEAVLGGASACYSYGSLYPIDCGSVYKLAPDGTFTTLHSFQGGADGGVPLGGLLIDKSGNLYGTTSQQGVGGVCASGAGCGTVFKIAPGGTMTTLYDFQGENDGGGPAGGLISDKQHNLYGTAGGGSGGGGVVFKLTPHGVETVLYSFQGGVDGVDPQGLVFDAAGNLYGTTVTGGGAAETGLYGTFFKLAAGGTKTTLHIFGEDGTDGRTPIGALLLDNKGDIYGTTYYGGEQCKGYGCGTVYKVAGDGTYTKLLTLNPHVAHTPQGGLVSDAKGDLFGNARAFWGSGDGIVYTMRK